MPPPIIPRARFEYPASPLPIPHAPTPAPTSYPRATLHSPLPVSPCPPPILALPWPHPARIAHSTRTCAGARATSPPRVPTPHPPVPVSRSFCLPTPSPLWIPRPSPPIIRPPISSNPTCRPLPPPALARAAVPASNTRSACFPYPACTACISAGVEPHRPACPPTRTPRFPYPCPRRYHSLAHASPTRAAPPCLARPACSKRPPSSPPHPPRLSTPTLPLCTRHASTAAPPPPPFCPPHLSCLPHSALPTHPAFPVLPPHPSRLPRSALRTHPAFPVQPSPPVPHPPPRCALPTRPSLPASLPHATAPSCSQSYTSAGKPLGDSYPSATLSSFIGPAFTTNPCPRPLQRYHNDPTQAHRHIDSYRTIFPE
ncbi:hypothetical protein B0H14DRAFT_3441259 [Mycena olivaceomarginata]|nr:hypothetical protein B0H14DRAFT_3441259 [Mycena olivaceomarginata]